MVIIHACLGTGLCDFQSSPFNLSRREFPVLEPHPQMCEPKVMSHIRPTLRDQEPLSILWSRDGDFDNRPGAWFEPNHFVPVISQSEGENVNQLPAKQGKTTGSGKKQQGTLFSFVQTKSKSKLGADNISPTCTESPMPSHKRNAETAKLSGDAQPNVKKSATSSITQKIRHKWKDEFPWLIISEDNLVLCSVCCNAPEVAGKNQFLTTVLRLKRKLWRNMPSVKTICVPRQLCLLSKSQYVRQY